MRILRTNFNYFRYFNYIYYASMRLHWSKYSTQQPSTKKNTKQPSIEIHPTYRMKLVFILSAIFEFKFILIQHGCDGFTFYLFVHISFCSLLYTVGSQKWVRDGEMRSHGYERKCCCVSVTCVCVLTLRHVCCSRSVCAVRQIAWG